jgi:putative addiction module killer protein
MDRFADWAVGSRPSISNLPAIVDLDFNSHMWEFCFVQIERTSEFKFWFDEQTEKAKAQIDARLKNIEMFDYFGDHKSLGEKLIELRWKNGRRVYYTLAVHDTLTLILLGGFKNAQEKDIKKARKILERERNDGEVL